MKLALVALLAGSAAAFAPSPGSVKSTALNTVSSSPYANELGVQPPTGFYDPLELLKNADQERFDRLRYVELKHGRIAQLAFLGYWATWSGLRLPGYIDEEGLRFADIPAGLAAISKVPLAGISQIFFFIGFLELAGWKQAEGSFPGDFSATPLFPVGWLGEPSDEEKLELRAKELNQGRAAMMGILGNMVHEQLNGHPFIFGAN